MAIKDSKTEELIKETAMRVFFAEGKLHATTQDIADAAGVNRALLHYYFRSREILFDVVFREAMDQMHKKMDLMLQNDDSFKNKIAYFIKHFTEMSVEYPYLEAFIITEVVRNPCNKELFMEDAEKKERVEKFFAEAQHAIDTGELAATSPAEFMVNLMSLVAYPILAKPIVMDIFKLDDHGWKQWMLKRAAELPDLIFGWEKRK